MRREDSLINAAKAIKEAKYLIITAGAGMGVDSIYIKDLVFRGMKQTIKENNL
jgi:hypothetical protein